MARGKQKGFKKDRVVIEDNSITPFYVVDEDRQYILMKKGSTIPFGYFTSLGNALQSVSRELHRNSNTQQKLNLSEYLKRYDELSNKILNALQV